MTSGEQGAAASQGGGHRGWPVSRHGYLADVAGVDDLAGVFYDFEMSALVDCQRGLAGSVKQMNISGDFIG
jgi:hypothetical protein